MISEQTDIPLHATQLIVVENTPDVHNVVVCTLCSCYPRELLGLPPDWYKSFSYRSRVVQDPRAVLRFVLVRIMCNRSHMWKIASCVVVLTGLV